MNKQHRVILYLLHIGLMLAISKVLTIFCLLCLCANREYPGSFQNKQVSSSFKCVSKYILFLTKLKGEGRPFWSGQAYIYPLNYLLHVGVMLNIIKVFIILFLLCLWEYGTRFLKQISKLSFQMSVQVYSFLGETEGEKKTIFERQKKGSTL